MSKTFADLETGDVFIFDNHVGRESWVKTEPHQARVVNSDYARNVGDEEPVTVLYAAADRAERLRPRHDDTSVEMDSERDTAVDEAFRKIRDTSPDQDVLWRVLYELYDAGFTDGQQHEYSYPS